MMEYIIFFGMIIVTLILWIIHEKKYSKNEDALIDRERIKLESPIERRLYDALKFRGETIQTQVPCGRYRIDLTLPYYRIAIECDGKAFHSTTEQKARDKRKNVYLKKHGWKVLRFSGRAIYRNMNNVISTIEKNKNELQIK